MALLGNDAARFSLFPMLTRQPAPQYQGASVAGVFAVPIVVHRYVGEALEALEARESHASLNDQRLSQRSQLSVCDLAFWLAL